MESEDTGGITIIRCRGDKKNNVDKMRLVVVESPFAGDTAEELGRNIRYAQACMHDSLMRGEAPYASHLLYTQEGILDDTIPEERRLGSEAGLLWGANADLVAVYIDLGITERMRHRIGRADNEGRSVDYRNLGGKWSDIAGT